MRAMLLLLTFLLISFSSFSQNKTKIDSLKTELKKEIHDTTCINLLNTLAWQRSRSAPTEALEYALEALYLSEKIENQKLIANSFHKIAWAHYLQGNYPKSLECNFKTLAIRKAQLDYRGIAVSLSHLGIVYMEQGDYPKTLKHYFEALEINKELGNKNGIATCIGNIGLVYWKQGDYPKALKHYFEALEINKELGNKNAMALDLGNIGIIYSIQGDYPKALKHFFEALEIDKELELKTHMGTTLSNIGNVYKDQGDSTGAAGNHTLQADRYRKALKHYFEALEIGKELGNKKGIAIRLANIGSLYIKQKKHKEAEESLLQALALCESIGALNVKMQFEKIISEELYTETHNYKNALYHYKQYTTTKDSLFNEAKSKDIGRLEQTHEFELAEIERQKQEAEQARVLAEQTQRRNQLQYSGIVLVLVGLFIGLFLFARRFRKVKEEKTFRQYTNIVEAALFISFLIFFEFILVVLDPYIEQITGGAPLMKLGFNALLAGVIFPIHSLLETKLKGQVIKTERKKWVAEAVKGKNLILVIGLGLVLGLNSGFDASTPLSTGSSEIDSLKTVLSQSPSDTIRIKTLLKLGTHLRYTEPDTALNYYEEALSIAKAINHKKLIAGCNNSIGRIYLRKSDYPQALHYYNEALSINEQLKDIKAMAGNYNNIGGIYMHQSTYPLALSYYFKSLKIAEEHGNKQGMAISYNNIGLIYMNQSTYPLALSYYFKSLKIYEEQGNKQGMAGSYGNIGNIYYNQSTYPLALTYFFKCLKINEEQGNKQGMAGSYICIGMLYTTLYEQGDSLDRAGEWAAENPAKLLDSAMYYQQKALSVFKKLSQEYGMSLSLSGIASILMQKGA
ncbi:MAG: hypothetical protein COC01_10035 [Bacteroidetes bacterium]|nr:MAG: hypothetical protein COC01_10035 [Bacteroidota bacterium]